MTWPVRGQKAPNFWDDDLRDYIDSADEGAATRLDALEAGPAGVDVEQVQDTVAAMLLEGTGVTLTYDDTAGTLTVDAAGGGGGGSASGPDILLPGETSVDEFDDDTIDAAWVRVDKSGSAGRVTWTEARGVMSADHTTASDDSNELHGLMRPLGTAMAVGDAFVAAFRIFGAPGSNYIMGGLILSDGVAHGAGNQLINLSFYGGDQTNDLRTVTNYANGSGNSAQRSSPAGVLTHVRIVKTGATTWRLDISGNGISWQAVDTMTWAQTPTHVGLHITNWGSTVNGSVTFEYLRRVAGVS